MTEDEKVELEARLENWARWSRNRKVKGRSSLCGVIEELRLKNGYPDEDTMYNEQMNQPVDQADAVRVDTAFSRFPRTRYQEMQMWRLLIDLYVRPNVSFEKRCYVHKIRHRDYEDTLARGKTILHNILKKVDSRYAYKV